MATRRLRLSATRRGAAGPPSRRSATLSRTHGCHRHCCHCHCRTGPLASTAAIGPPGSCCELLPVATQPLQTECTDDHVAAAKSRSLDRGKAGRDGRHQTDREAPLLMGQVMAHALQSAAAHGLQGAHTTSDHCVPTARRSVPDHGLLPVAGLVARALVTHSYPGPA